MTEGRGLNFSLTRRTPVILQSEVAECGLACVAMVASHHGWLVDIRSLRRRFDVSLKGLSLKHMTTLAERCQLSSRAVRCELNELDHLRLPAILHWNLNHFVVLTKVNAESCWIHDPAMGLRKISIAECSQHFSGVALELTPNIDFAPSEDRQSLPLRKFWQSTGHLASSLSLLLFLSLLIQVTAIAAPYYMQWVIDHVVLTSDRDLLFVLAIGFGLIMLFGAVLASLRSWLVLRLASVLNLHLSVALLNHLLRLPLNFFEKRHVGDIVSRFSSLGQIRERVTTGVVETVVDGLMSIVMLCIMLMYSVSLTAISISAVLLYLIIRALSYGMFFRLNEKSVHLSANEQTNFLETVRGIRTVKLMSSENLRLSQWENKYTDVLNNDIQVGKLSISFTFAGACIFGVENILVVYHAAGAVLDGQLTVGMMLAFMAYKTQLSSRMMNLVEQWITFRMLGLHVDRIADIALAEPEQTQSLVESFDSTPVAAMEVLDVTFSYGQNERAVLSNISFTIPAGAYVAIVGPSGEGKSTLVKLLLGLAVPTSGKVLCDGVDIQHIGYRQFRQSISAVMQDDCLLSGSIADNICFFDVQADMDRIQACATATAIHNDIVGLPMGYQSLVGDMGCQLSGGQIQRVLLARALYRNSRILFLDEATSHLDDRNEQHIKNLLTSLDMTRVVVAHKRPTIEQADYVLLVANGEVAVLSSREYFARLKETAPQEGPYQ